MVETINMMERNYERSLQYAKQEFSASFKGKDEMITKSRRSGLYWKPDRNTIAFDEMS